MVTTQQINIKNRNYYFYNDLINIKDFDPKLLNLGKRISMDIDIYYIDYVSKKMSINLIVLFYLLVHRIDGFIEEKE